MTDGSGFKLAGEPSTTPLPPGTLRLGLDPVLDFGSFCLSFASSLMCTALQDTPHHSRPLVFPHASPQNPWQSHLHPSHPIQMPLTYYRLSTNSSGWELLCPSPYSHICTWYQHWQAQERGSSDSHGAQVNPSPPAFLYGGVRPEGKKRKLEGIFEEKNLKRCLIRSNLGWGSGRAHVSSSFALPWALPGGTCYCELMVPGSGATY